VATLALRANGWLLPTTIMDFLHQVIRHAQHTTKKELLLALLFAHLSSILSSSNAATPDHSQSSPTNPNIWIC
jgi:hypothetical protein